MMAAVANQRDDFTAPVKEALARRVGYRCSHPNCRRVTSGPAQDPHKAVNLGVAAHVTAAAEGGPRYDESLTPEQRRSVENGIWLCQNHAKLIDSDEPQFTVDLLRQWKQDAEEAATRELAGHEARSQLGDLALPDADALRRISEARTRRRLRSAGLTDDEKLLRALDVLSGSLEPAEVLSLRPGRILVLVGQLGSGKSEIAEAWHRRTIDQYADGTGPVPVWLRARGLNTDLVHEVTMACGGKNMLASRGCDLVLDELDALSDLRRVRELLDDVAIFAESAGNVRVLLTLRPGYPVPQADVVTVEPLPQERGVAIASAIAQIPEWQMARWLIPEALEAIRTPLFAVLIGAEATEVADLVDRPSLLKRLAERALDVVSSRAGLPVTRERIRSSLRREIGRAHV